MIVKKRRPSLERALFLVRTAWNLCGPDETPHDDDQSQVVWHAGKGMQRIFVTYREFTLAVFLRDFEMTAVSR
ncbi:hypothetical protein ACFC0X_02225 [Paenibacillus chitinolyticus]|uniref:hypothetical protein n=1 Tax=Paenibacillus chitinolyticus TaxID=79263 RepID=UPI0035E10224